MSRDANYFKGFIKGYEEGLNKAWDELIGLTTRNYSSREIQVMAKSKRQSVDQLVRAMARRIEETEGVQIFAPTTKPSIAAQVEAGRTYILEGQSLDRTAAVFNAMVAQGLKGLCILRRYPPEVRDQFAGHPKMYWLTKQEYAPGEEGGVGPDELLSPTELPKIITVFRSFLKESKGGVVVLEGIEYLILQNDLAAVLKFVSNLRDQNITSKGVLLLPVDPGMMEARDLKFLERSIENRL